MANSYRKIDYRLRPAKAVERRMIAEYFLRLRPFGPVEDYRYIGLGSVYFSDFALFHNICGFKEMVSIEGTQDPTIKQRFSFNSPLGTIDLKFGFTNTELPKLHWKDKKSAVWLDFDGPLDSSVLTDINFLGSVATPESILWVSVNGELIDTEEGELSKLDILKNRIGVNKVPARLQEEKNLPAKDIAQVYQEILKNELSSAITARNSGREADEALCFEQVAYFKYSDGATMFTVGWVLFLEKDRAKFNHCAFSQLNHFRSGGQPFFIDIPLMTNAEMRELNRCKLINDELITKHIPLPESEIKKYTALKRFWPVLQIPEMT
jgi:hypothetical protein